jgi:hypothetical protein
VPGELEAALPKLREGMPVRTKEGVAAEDAAAVSFTYEWSWACAGCEKATVSKIDEFWLTGREQERPFVIVNKIPPTGEKHLPSGAQGLAGGTEKDDLGVWFLVPRE